MVLNGTHYHVGSAMHLQVRQRRPFDGEVVSFGAPTRKNHLGRRTSQHLGDIVTGTINGNLAGLSHGMRARGIAVVLSQIGHHSRQHIGSQRRGGSVVCVDNGRIHGLILQKV